MNLAFADFETRSTADLKRIGGRAYAAHPHTQVLCLAVVVDGDAHLWVPVYTGPLEIPGVTLHRGDFPFTHLLDRSWVGHNADFFDAHILREKCGVEPQWLDTLPLARAAGLPGGLDKAGTALGIGHKDEGGRFLKKLCFGEVRDGEALYPPLLPGYVQAVCRYCVEDVRLLERLHARVGECQEPAVLSADRAINARGVYLDRGLAAAVCRLSTQAVAYAATELEALTGGKIHAGNMRSGKQVLEWVNAQGVYLWRPDDEDKQSLDKRLVEKFIADPEAFVEAVESTGASLEVPATVARVLRTRQTATRQVGSKLEGALDAVSPDSRLRDLFVYHGAHTGRWTSHRVQVHNLAKPGKKYAKALSAELPGLLASFDAAGDLSFPEVAAAAARVGCPVDDVLTALTRPCFRAAPGKTLWVYDYAGVEARWVAWWSGQSDLTHTFATGGDVYCEMAASLFGRPITKADELERQVGKVMILGMGYGMGAGRFASYCAQEGIDLAALGLTAKQCVEAYRGRYPAIPRLWKACGDAMMNAVRWGHKTEVNGVSWWMEGQVLICRLPSGRRMSYRNARAEMRVPGYCKALGLPELPRLTVVYDSPRRTDDLFGGKGTENVAQAGCRDFMADALTRLPGVVLHVHDEVACEIPLDSQEPLAKIVCTLPAWAPGFPLEIEWHRGDRYVKGGVAGCPSGKERA